MITKFFIIKFHSHNIKHPLPVNQQYPTFSPILSPACLEGRYFTFLSILHIQTHSLYLSLYIPLFLFFRYHGLHYWINYITNIIWTLYIAYLFWNHLCTFQGSDSLYPKRYACITGQKYFSGGGKKERYASYSTPIMSFFTLQFLSCGTITTEMA